MRRIFEGVFALLTVSLLVGCGESTWDGYYTAPREEYVNYEDYVRRFQIYDARTLAPGRPEVNGRSPFVALLDLSKSDSRVIRTHMCSASHIRRGKLLTNAHCVQSNSTRGMYAVYYDKFGRKQFSPIVSIAHLGHPGEDIAVLNLPSEKAADMDVLEGETRQLRVEGKDSAPSSLQSKVWSFDPVGTTDRGNRYRYPEILKSRENNAHAMVFRPNLCTASRDLPVVRGTLNGESKERDVELKGRNPDQEIYLKDCERPIVKGNSGSLVTSADNITQKVAVAFAIFPNNDNPYYRGFGSFRVGTNPAIANPSVRDGAHDAYFFGLGVDLFRFVTRMPGLIN